MSDSFDTKLLEIFEQEGTEQATEIDKNVLMLEFLKSQNSFEYSEHIKDTITSIFGVVHTLKASAGSLGYSNLSSFLHNVESCFAEIKKGELKLDAGIISFLIDISATIKNDVNYVIENRKDIIEGKYDSMTTEINKFIEDKFVSTRDNKTTKAPVSEVQKESQPFHYFQIIMHLNPDLLKTGTDPLMLLRELYNMGEIIQNNPDPSDVPELNKLVPEELYITWDIILKTTSTYKEVDEVFIFVKHTSEILIEDISERYTETGIDKLAADRKLGEILIEKGQVKEEDVREAVSKQKRIGEILIEEGKASPEAVQNAISVQEDSKKNFKTTSVRVNIDKLDLLVNQIGELVIAQSRIVNMSEQVQEIELKRLLFSTIEDSTRIVKELQEGIMSTRMITIDSTFTQFYRVVRDLSLKQNKKIRLVLTGQETELDKNVIEKINSPLKHMIRNSIDHGIETPEDREKAGKPKEAIIQLKAYHKDGSVVIEIADDGKGLDRDSIYKKAIASDLISDDEDVSDDYLYNQIFNPGFSTAASVTDVSGRGVGMDVVKKTVQELRGRIEIKTEKGIGTTFIIKLPLTLAIIDGLLVSIGKRLFILPLLSIHDVFKPTKTQVRTVESKGEYIDVRDSCYTMVRLHHLLKINRAITDPTNAILLSVKVAGRFYCLMVDDIVDQKQIVIKSMEDNYTKIPGFSGATILGDGNVAMILEPNELVTLYKQRNAYMIDKEVLVNEQ